MKVGIIGLGRMGGAIADRLLAHGVGVVGFDSHSDATERAASRGIAVVHGLRDLTEKCDAVISSVTDDSSVLEVFRGSAGLLSHEVAGKLFIEMSTLQPKTGRELAPLVEDRGARFVESPVLGTIAQVRDGNLVALVGGKPADVSQASDILDKLSRSVIHVGPHGTGYAMKLTINLGLAAYTQALAELITLGLAEGLGVEQVLDVWREGPLATGRLEGKRPVLMGSTGEVTLDIRTMRKDVMSIVATGAAAGVAMPLSSAVLSAFPAAVAGGAGSGDVAEIATFWRKQMVQSKLASGRD